MLIGVGGGLVGLCCFEAVSLGINGFIISESLVSSIHSTGFQVTRSLGEQTMVLGDFKTVVLGWYTLLQEVQ